MSGGFTVLAAGQEFLLPQPLVVKIGTCTLREAWTWQVKN